MNWIKKYESHIVWLENIANIQPAAPINNYSNSLNGDIDSLRRGKYRRILSMAALNLEYSIAVDRAWISGVNFDS